MTNELHDAPSPWWTTLPPQERAEAARLNAGPIWDRPDFVIVDGGIVGLAAGLAVLSTPGPLKRVQILLSRPAACLGSAESGLLSLLARDVPSPSARARLMEARDHWAELAVRPGYDFDWRVPGLLVIDPARAKPDFPAAARAWSEQGLAVQPLDENGVRRLAPGLNAPAALAALAEAQIHPLRAALSLARRFVELGGRIRAETGPLRLAFDGGRLAGMHAAEMRLEPQGPVLLAGDQPPNGWSPAADDPWALETRARRFLSWTADGPPLARPVVAEHGILLLPAPPAPQRGDASPPLRSSAGRSAAAGPRTQALVVAPGDLERTTIAGALARIWPGADGSFQQEWICRFGRTHDGEPRYGRLPGTWNAWFLVGCAGDELACVRPLARAVREALLPDGPPGNGEWS